MLPLVLLILESTDLSVSVFVCLQSNAYIAELLEHLRII